MPKHALLSASASHRWLNCPPSANSNISGALVTVVYPAADILGAAEAVTPPAKLCCIPTFPLASKDSPIEKS